MNNSTFTVLRCTFGALFVLIGLSQTDYVGKKMFPVVNEHFEHQYNSHLVHTIPWTKFGLKVSADVFREVIGYTSLICGLFLLVNFHVRLAAFVMAVVGVWSVYAHLYVGDPMYRVVSGSVIVLVMLSIAFPLYSKDKQD